MSFLEAFKEVKEYHKFVYLRLLAFAGLRRGEALALYEPDIIKDKKVIDINKTLVEDEAGKTYLSFSPKTQESKNLVYLDDDTYNYLIELINSRNEHDQYGKIINFYSLVLKQKHTTLVQLQTNG